MRNEKRLVRNKTCLVVSGESLNYDVKGDTTCTISDYENSRDIRMKRFLDLTVTTTIINQRIMNTFSSRNPVINLALHLDIRKS